jgi:RNA polymerase sigma factor (sigma-70 family)
MPRWKLTRTRSKLLRLERELHAYFRKRVAQTADADDLLSQLWVAAGQRFRGEASPRYYTFQVARGLIADYWYRARRPGLACASAEDLDEVLEDAEQRVDKVDEDADLDQALFDQYRFEQLEGALAQVPKVYRDALDLQLRGYDNFKIGEALGIEYPTVRSRLSRGKKHLMRLLAEVRRAEGT